MSTWIPTPTSRWPAGSPTTPRSTGQGSATRPRRCSSTPRSPAELLPGILADLAAAGVELVGDGRTQAAAGETQVGAAAEADWDTEYHGMKMAVGVVDSAAEAIEHINAHGTGHTEAIVTSSDAVAAQFTEGVDAAVVLRQRLDAVHRRLRVRDGRRDRQLDPEASRPRADRPARADDDQVRDPRRRPSAGVAIGSVGVLGGAFNPPHIGHLVLAQEAASQLGLDTGAAGPRRPSTAQAHRPRAGGGAAARDGPARRGWRRAARGRIRSRSSARARPTPSVHWSCCETGVPTTSSPS